MKVDALRKLRERRQADQPTFGLWITLESPSLTEMAVALGCDWVVIDAEHGHLDWNDVIAHLRATVRSDTVALVRIAELNGSLIKRALDCGADGVVIPFVETAEQLRQAIAWAKYPPEGRRGIGAERATCWGQCIAEHAAEANENVLVVPILETVHAAEQLPEMCRVDGAEAFFFGPADFSASAGHRGQWQGPGVGERILALKDELRKAGKTCGIIATDDADLHARREQGFRMIGLGIDGGLFLRALKNSLQAAGRETKMATDLRPPPSTVAAVSASRRSPSAAPFRVAVTADFFDEDRRWKYRDVGLDLLVAEPQIAWRPFELHEPEITPEQLAGCHAAVVLTPRTTVRTFAGLEDFLAIGRFGVGYDNVDVAACTAHDVALFIAAGAVDRSVAEATIGWMFSLAQRAHIKDKLVREARWDERSRYMGSELRDKTLGIIGFGGIGRTVARLLAGFGMRPPLVFDPLLTPAQVAQHGARSVPLDELLREADFVSLHCPLTERTRGLLSARELGLMKPTAYLINTARGGIVDEDALYAALREGRIAGAAVDCFAEEPLQTPPRSAELDDVIFAPHSIAWTDELFRDIGRCVWRGMIDLSHGRRPAGVVNPEVFERPGFLAKWKRIIGSTI